MLGGSGAGGLGVTVNQVSQDTGKVRLRQGTQQAQVKVSAFPPTRVGCPLIDSDDYEEADNSRALG